MGINGASCWFVCSSIGDICRGGLRKYLLACQSHIELNPIRAGLVSDPADYTWSSYRAHAFGHSARMWRPHAEYLALGQNKAARCSAYRKLFNQKLEKDVITDILNAINTGLVLGNERFQREVERLTGECQYHKKRGPRLKPKKIGNI